MTRTLVLSACALLLLSNVAAVGVAEARPACSYFLDFDFKTCNELTRPVPGQMCETVTVDLWTTGTHHAATWCTIDIIWIICGSSCAFLP